MPTFASLPLENLLEPRARDSLKKPLSEREQEDPNRTSEQRPRHLYISPALYVTPEQAPIPEHSSHELVSPSPYLANQKRRRGGDELSRVDPGQVPDLVSRDEAGDFRFEEVVEENFVNENLVGNEDDEGFLDLRGEFTSVESEVEANDFGRQIESRSFVSAQGEFFDANDDFSSDGSISNIPSCGSRIESELHATRLSILEEIEKRKTAEEALILMRSQWQRINNLMNQAGFKFPAPPAVTDNARLMDNSIEQFFQEVVVARFVAEAIGRGQARAEAEEAAATIIESKDQEIVRLRDRLQYYETVNHEMSQRKLIEVARRQQERKRRRRTWIWSFMGLSIAIGASFVAYSFIPHSDKYLSLPESGNFTDDSHVRPS